MGHEVPAGLETPPETTRLIRRWKWRRFFVWFGVFALVLVVLSGTTTWIRDGLMRPLVLHETPVTADVIIVLGSGTRKGAEPLPSQAKQRVLESIQLWKDGYAPAVIMSGGQDRNTKLVESQEMSSYAITQKLPANVIIAEDQSKDTYQNAKYSLAIMAEHDWKTALVVTSPYHTWRACKIFRKQQAAVKCIQAPFSLLKANSFYERLMDTRSVLREYGAVVYNKLKGEI